MERIKNDSGIEKIVLLTNGEEKNTLVRLQDGQTMHTVQTATVFESHAEAMSHVAGTGVDVSYGLEDLPEEGIEVLSGAYYKHEGRIVYCRQTHIRTEHTEETTH